MDLRKNRIEATLVFPVRGEGNGREVLLARKARKLVVGCPNGFGGSLNRREKPRACAVRELKSESGLIALEEDLDFVAIMEFHNQRDGGGEFVVRVYVFILNRWRGKLKLKEDEARDSRWYKVSRLPIREMAPSDAFWVPQIFAGKKIKGKVWHGPSQRSLTRLPEIKVVNFLSDIG